MKERLFVRGKKCLSVLLAMLMVFTLVSTGAAESYSSEDIAFNEESTIEESIAEESVVEENSEDVQPDDEEDLLGSISGSMWSDSNTNGLWDEDEYGIPGLTVSLYADGEEIAAAITEADGSYVFEGLEAGDYAVRVSAQTVGEDEYLIPMKSLQSGEDNKFDANLDTDPVVAESALLTLNNGDSLEGIDAGMRGKVLTTLEGVVGSSSRMVSTAAELKSAVEDGINYVTVTKSITLDQHITLPQNATTFIEGRSSGITITRSTKNTSLKGAYKDDHRHFVVSKGASLTLKNITLAGVGLQNGDLGIYNGGVYVGDFGTLTITSGATIKNCFNARGAVEILNGMGKMNDTGSISYNYTSGGVAGVKFYSNGETPYHEIGFEANGGKISYNKNVGNGSYVGVALYADKPAGRTNRNESVILNDIEISHNNGESNSFPVSIVRVSTMKFELYNARINYNTSSGSALWYSFADGYRFSFNMEDSSVNYNTFTGKSGHAICFGIGIQSSTGNGMFSANMSGVDIIGNKTAGDGAGIYLGVKEGDSVKLRITGSRIMNNVAAGNGGGIFTEGYSYENPADTSMYHNLEIASDVVFSGNKSARTTTPPTNKSSFSSRFNGNLLNNNDINYSPDEYYVNYSANGGSGAPSSQKKQQGTGVVLSSTKPTRAGYTFQGWGTYSAATTVSYAPGSTYSKDANITLYAIWKLNVTYSITYNANGGSGAPASQTKADGVNVVLSSVKPVRTGYTFKGWGTSSTTTTVSYAPGATYSKNANITLYAVWSKSEYTIVYWGGTAGKNEPDPQIKYHNVDLQLSTYIPTREGEVFLYWYDVLGATDNGNYYPGQMFTENTDVYFIAMWAVDENGDGIPDSDQKKVIYDPGTMNGEQIKIMLSKTENSFVTMNCPEGWSNSVDVFDGWAKKDGTIVECSKGIYYEADETDGEVMTLTAVTSTWKTAVSIEASITSAEDQAYLAKEKLHTDGVTVTVKYRDGTTAIYDTPEKISEAGITLKTENDKGVGTAVTVEDNGQHLIASKKQPDNTTITSSPSAEAIKVSKKQYEITLIVIGGDTYTKDILSVSDSQNNILAATLNTATASGKDGETYTVRQSVSLDKDEYKLVNFTINGEDYTSDFADGLHSFTLTQDTTVYVVYSHEAAENEYNVYANVLSGGGTGTIQARVATGSYTNIPDKSIMDHISYDDGLKPVKKVAEGLEADAQHISIALLPDEGYRVGTVILNGEFLTKGHDLWRTDGKEDVIILLPKDDNGNIIDRTSYYLSVSYVKITPEEDHTVTMKTKTIKGGIEVSAAETGNEVIIGGGLYSETGYNMSYPEGTIVPFGARPGRGYVVTEIKVDGKEMALTEGDYFSTLPPINKEYEIEVTFVHKSDISTTVEVLETETTTLRGNWADEQEGDVSFWVTINDEAVSSDDMSMFEINAAPALSWKDAGTKYHEMLSEIPTLTGETKTVGGKIYSEMKIPVEVRKSGVTAVELKTKEGTVSTTYVLTPGNTSSAFATLDAADVTNAIRVVNETNSIPGKGLENNFIFEMMDMNKDKGISSSDITNMIRIINGQQSYYAK